MNSFIINQSVITFTRPLRHVPRMPRSFCILKEIVKKPKISLTKFDLTALRCYDFKVREWSLCKHQSRITG